MPASGTLITETAMKLYYATGACSLAPHIVIQEAGLQAELIRVDTKTHKVVADGSDFYAINPKGYVPMIELDGGERLTEAQVVMQYLADLAPQSGLLPPAGSLARVRVQEWLAYISSEVHTPFGPLFHPSSDEMKADARQRITARLTWIDQQLAGHDYLTGPAFTPADAYLFTVTRWTKYAGVDIEPFANLRAFMARVAARPAVQRALAAEGIKG